jgi:hypothetical protein
VPALEQVRHAARELDHLEAAGDLAHRVGVHLAVLARDDRGQLVLAGVDQLAEREQHLRTPRKRRGAPRAGGAGGGRDHGGRVGLARQGDPSGHLTGRRVGHVGPAGGLAGQGGAVGPVHDVGHVGHAVILLAATRPRGCRIVGIGRSDRTLRHPARA